MHVVLFHVCEEGRVHVVLFHVCEEGLVRIVLCHVCEEGLVRVVLCHVCKEGRVRVVVPVFDLFRIIGHLSIYRGKLCRVAVTDLGEFAPAISRYQGPRSSRIRSGFTHICRALRRKCHRNTV